MAIIKAIEGGTIHQIQSGQVIVDLCSVVKELVENSLDAGATSIDVRFKNQGLDAVEVQDNGDGISVANYDTLALKHYTSKLSTYSDLTTLQTFGFRGEALSSLCALSNFSVVTCMAQDAPKGTKLEFEVSGKLKHTSVVAAQRGTTVIVENLFNNLPVRRRELERNIKREWGRVVSHLNQYACIQTGIKFSVSQQTGKGKKTIIFSTKGNPTTRENIANVFGAKTLAALIVMDLKLELEPTSGPSQRWSIQDDGGRKDIRIVGHISRPANGEGRQTPDRQMFFVNSRPCGLPQVAKAFNEVYKSYNGSQSPFIFANIELDTHLYDVNVSPDKRTILLHDQNRMLENLKGALTALFESQDYTVPLSLLPVQKQPSYKQLSITRDSTTPSKTPQPETPKIPRNSADPGTEDESELESRASRLDQSADSAGLRQTSVSNNRRESASQESRRRVLSRESYTKTGESVSLISSWLERKTKNRSEEAEEGIKPVKPAEEKSVGLSKDKLKLVEKLTEQGQKEQLPKASEDVQIFGFGNQDLNLFDLGLRGSSVARQRSSSVLDASPESPIPAPQSPPEPASSIDDRFSSGVNSYRPPAEIATITIGDHTVISSLGTPCPKRSKQDDSVSTAPNERQTAAGASRPKLPSFGNILSQRFAAPGTAAQDAQDEDDGFEDVDDAANRVASPQSVQSSTEGHESHDEHPEIQTADIEQKEADRPIDAQNMDDGDASYIDEDQKKALEEIKVQEMIKEAENSAILLAREQSARAKVLVRGGVRKKETTVNLIQRLETSTAAIEKQFRTLETRMASYQAASIVKSEDDGVESTNAEEKLSLTISKSDFTKMKIIGQFNLGFILASRTSDKSERSKVGDDLFIIDQHASDEKYNFERLQATTIVQSQRLVHSKILDLTAMEEEIVMENLSTLSTNGFIVTVDDSGSAPVGKRCSLVALPVSRETAFSLTDLEELIALLAEPGVLAGGVPRPGKVRKMFAMRACRSSVMIGKTLTVKQMGGLVGHLGELDKPWNCPHGRPTMRHLCGLDGWDEAGWREGDVLGSEEEGVGLGEEVLERRPRMDWVAWCREKRSEMDKVGMDGIEGNGEVEGYAEADTDALAEDEMDSVIYEAFSTALKDPEAEPEDEEDSEEIETDGDESTEEGNSEEL